MGSHRLKWWENDDPLELGIYIYIYILPLYIYIYIYILPFNIYIYVCVYNVIYSTLFSAKAI